MEREPSEFGEKDDRALPERDDNLPRLSGAALDEALARARASYAAGGGVDHDIVSIWLRTWGTRHQRPFREWLASPDG